VHDEEPLATEDALRNVEHALKQLACERAELAEDLGVFRMREASSRTRTPERMTSGA
jgi:hypothetical protein